MPEYYAHRRELTTRPGMPMPQLYVVARPAAQRLRHRPQPRPRRRRASPRASSQVLDWDELRGVLAHEISHVGNRDILIGSVAAAVAMGITFVARMADVGRDLRWRRRDDDGGNAFGAAGPGHPRPDGRHAAADGPRPAAGSSRPTAPAPTDRHRRAAGPGPRRSSTPTPSSIPMDIDPAQAQAYIVNPLRGPAGELRQRCSPATRPSRSGSPASASASGASPLVPEVLELEGDAEVLLLQGGDRPPGGRPASCR